MEYLHFYWHCFLEMQKYLKVFMVGNSDRLFEDRGFRVGWRSKTFRYRISSYSTEFWYKMLSNNGTIFLTVFFSFCSGASSFNHFIHELSMDSDNSSLEYSSSGEEDSDRYEYPPSPASHSSRASEAAFARNSRHQMNWIQYILLWILLPVKSLLRIPLRLLHFAYFVVLKVLHISREKRPSRLHAYRRVQSIKDHFIHRATDGRRGIVEVCTYNFY